MIIPFSRYLIVFFVIKIIFLFILMIFSLDKGFDLKDEGLALALGNGEVFYKNSFFNYNVFFPINLGIIELRILKLLFVFLMIFAVLRIRNWKFVPIDFLFLIIGIFCMYSLFGQSFSYNNFVFILLFTYFSVYINLSSKNFYFVFFLLGIIVGFIFYSKFTSSLSLFFWTFLLVTLNSQYLFKVKINLIVVFSIAFFLVHVLVFSWKGENIFWNTVLIGLEYSSYSSNYHKTELFLGLISAIRWAMVVIFSGMFLGFFTKSSIDIKLKFISFLLFIALITYFFLAHHTLTLFRFFEYSLSFFSLFIIGFLISRARIVDFVTNRFLEKATIFILPLVGFIGTNVYFFKFTQLFAFFYFVFIVFLFDYTDLSKSIKNFIVVFLSLLLTIRVVSNILIFPFNQPSFLGNLTLVSYGNNKEIRLENNQAKYIDELRRMLSRNLQDDSPVIGLYAMPGDIILSGYRNFYNPCIWDETQWKFLVTKMNVDGIDNFPLVLTDNFNSVIQQYPNAIILDSVSHFSSGKIYLLDINN